MEILNNASITIKNLSTIVLTIMPQHSQIRYGTSKKKKSRFEIVHFKDSSIIFEYNQKMSPRKIRNIILPQHRRAN